MPRKSQKLTTDDLDAIISGDCSVVANLADWAQSEKDRRELAGKNGGRPKGVTVAKDSLKIATSVENAKAEKFVEIKPRKPLAQRKKNWSTCPFGSHADDCDCRGMGGDR